MTETDPLAREAALRVLVVDDHALFRAGIVSILRDHGIKPVGEASDGEAAVRMAEALAPDMILMDLHMPVLDGVGATRKLAHRFPILILSISDNDEDLIRAVQAGAKGYLLKHAEADVLVAAIRQVARGEAVLAPELTGAAINALRQGHAPRDARTGDLSDRERQVLTLIARGKTNGEIAEDLDISAHTVKTYVERVFKKLGVTTRAEAATMAGTSTIR